MIIIGRLFSKLAHFTPGGSTIRPLLHRLRGVKIGKNVWISQYVYIDENHPKMISIGDNCTIGLRTSIIAHIYWGKRKKIDTGHIVIEKNVYIGPHCVILPNVRIGEGAVIKSGSTISRNIPAFTFWGSPPGAPLARVTVPLTSDHSYSEFVKGLRPIRKSSEK